MLCFLRSTARAWAKLTKACGRAGCEAPRIEESDSVSCQDSHGRGCQVVHFCDAGFAVGPPSRGVLHRCPGAPHVARVTGGTDGCQPAADVFAKSGHLAALHFHAHHHLPGRQEGSSCLSSLCLLCNIFCVSRLWRAEFTWDEVYA